MKVLALDTSNLVMGVALADEDRLLGEVVTNLKKNHSVRLMPTVESLIRDLNMNVRDLDGIVVAQGPGSYTGVRIGVATAKTLAWSLRIPLVAFSSLEVLATNAGWRHGWICPLFDARRGQVYTGLYYGNGNGTVTQEKADRIVLLEDWLTELPDSEPVLFAGDDTQKHVDVIRQACGDETLLAPPDWNVPRPGHLARMGVERLTQGEGEDVHTFVPAYLQLAEAEKNWLAKQK